MKTPKLRVARPTNDLEPLLKFYNQGLGLDILFRFEGHDGFDGVMLGAPDAPYHFEFTRSHEHLAPRAPTEDNLLIFYEPNHDVWQSMVERMQEAGFYPARSFNPYWDRDGITFEDPDGYRIVLQCSEWKF